MIFFNFDKIIFRMAQQKPARKPAAKPVAPKLQPVAQVTRKPVFWAETVIIILGVSLYANTLYHDYALDDAIVVVQNQFTNKGVDGLKDIFSYDTFTGFWMTSYPGKTADQIQEEKKLVAGGRYRPLSLVTFALENQVFGKKEHNQNGETYYAGNPHISHFINIILYVLTCLLLYQILKKLIPPRNPDNWYFSTAFIATMLFLAHPIHTEAVANIKGRDEIMTLLGSLGALWFTLRYLDTSKIVNLLLSSLCLFLGLLSKENAITFLALIPLSVHYFTKHKPMRNLISLIPLAVAAGVFLIIRYQILGGGSGEKEIAQELMNNPFVEADTSEKFATIFYTLWKYIQLLIFPHPLTYDYYPKQIPIIGWGDYRAFLPFLLYLALGIYAVWGMIRRKDVYSFSIWFYLIPLSVVSNLFFPVGTFMNERFVFISSIGFCILLGWLVVEKLPWLARKFKVWPGYMILPVFIVVMLLYSAKTFTRNKAWENDYVLFTTDVQTSVNSAKSTCSAGGKLIEEAQKPAIKADTALHNEYCHKAIAHLERSLTIYPEYVDAMNLLGNAWYELEMNSVKALEAYTRVLKLRPYHGVAIGNARVIINNAFPLLNSGKSMNSPEEILAALEALDKVKPGIPELYHLMGTIYGRYLNRLDLSIEFLNKSAALNNQNPSLFMDMGVAYGMSGDLQTALKNFLKAVELSPGDPMAWMNAGITYQHLGDKARAAEYINKANALKANSK